MLTLEMLTVGFGTALALISVGGGLYEFSVVDPFWPRRPEGIQPKNGGISRRRFWIPAHTLFELSLIASLILAWPEASTRGWLLTALASHALMRVWSAFDFIPKALAFERAEPANISEHAAKRWTSRSMLRLPLDVVTCFAMLAGFAAVAR